MALRSSRMRKLSALFAVLGLMAVACGGPASAPEATTTEAQPAGSTTTVPGSTTTAAPGGTTSSTVAVDGPPAPDFTLALGTGGEFTLSAEQKPVYMVFWAEW